MSPRRGVRDLDVIVETVIYLQTEGRRLAREGSQRAGITATQLSVLKLLGEIGELSLSELGRRIAAQNSTVTGIVDRMERDGLVKRERSAEDRRVWKIRPTELGQRLASSVAVAPWDLLREALGELERREQEQLVVLLRKVAENVKRKVQDG